MYCTMSPISSMCPSSMIVGEPPALTSAMLFPATSLVTLSANLAASSRQTRAAGASKPEGPGVSSRRLRNAMEDALNMVERWERFAASHRAFSNRECDEAQGENDESRDVPA